MVTRQKRPKYTAKSASIKRYMEFANSFKPPTLGFSLQLNNWDFHFKTVFWLIAFLRN